MLFAGLVSCSPDIFRASQVQHAVQRTDGDGDLGRATVGRGRWMDNVFIERLWRSLKYECVYLHAFETGSELRAGLTRWISYYNTRRPHSTLGGHTPDEAYGISTAERLAA